MNEQRGLRVVAFLGTQVLGDFIEYHLIAASVARAVPDSRLLVVYRDDRPYKAFSTLLNPWVTQSIAVPGDPGQVVPLDWFDGRENVPGRSLGPEFYAHGFHRPDIFLTPSMMGLYQARCIGSSPALRVPAHLDAPLARALAGAGVRPDRWIACVHMRENNYSYRRGVSPLRSVDPKAYLPMIRHIVDVQGGQVVRLGDPSMTPLPEMPGLVDLGRVPDTFPVQAYAVSRARYFVGTASGPLALACGFKVPAVTTNALDVCLWNDGNAVLPKRDWRLGGVPCEAREVIEALDVVAGLPRDLTFRDNTPEELIAAADHLFGRTADCSEWREPAAETKGPELPRIPLPLPRRRALEGVDVTWL